MAQVLSNTPLIERQHFIIRRLNQLDVPEAERATLEAEQDDLERRIAANLAEHLMLNSPQIRAERPSLADKSKSEIKKILAHWIKSMLKDLDETTRNGVLRRAYKGED